MKYLAPLCIIVSLAICSCKKSQEASAPPDPKDEFFAIIKAQQDAFAAGDAQKLADLSLEKSARKMKEHCIESGKGWPPPPDELKKAWEVVKNFMGESFPDKQKTVLQIEGDWARLKYFDDKKEGAEVAKD